MYLPLFNDSVVAGKSAEYEAKTGQMFAILKNQPGFVSARLNLLLGLPHRYQTLHRWEDREAYRRFALNRAVQEQIEEIGLGGICSAASPVAAYDLIHFVVAGPGDYISRIYLTIESGKQAAFEQSRKELFELQRINSAGFAHHGLYRYLGNQNDYMIGLVNLSLDGIRSLDHDPDVRRFVEENPLTHFTVDSPIEELSVTVLRV